jgi:hypothetical protein
MVPAATPVWTGFVPEYRNALDVETRVLTVVSSAEHGWCTTPWTGSHVSRGG